MPSQVKFNRVREKVSGNGSRKPWCKAKSGSMGSGEGYGESREALVQSQVRFNRVSEKVPEKV